MAGSLFLDGVRFVATSGGTTDWTYSSAVTGYQSPASAGAVNGAQYSYRAESADLSQWEMGIGTWTTSTGVLSRTTVLFSTNANAKVTFSAAPQVAIVALAEDIVPIGGLAIIDVTPANPSGSSNTTNGVYMGFGGVCAITPKRTTRVRAQFTFDTINSTSNGQNICQGFFGTGTAPVNGSTTVVGTSFGSAGDPAIPAGSVHRDVLCGIVTVVPGTAYWFDFTVMVGSASTANIFRPHFDAFEF